VTATSTTVISERLSVSVLPLDKVHGAPTRVGLPPPSPQLPLSVGPLSVGPLSVTPLGARAEERTLYDEVRQEIF
jgi:hypothetical protein